MRNNAKHYVLFRAKEEVKFAIWRGENPGIEFVDPGRTGVTKSGVDKREEGRFDRFRKMKEGG
jgi:hypothetical protein